MFFSELAKFRTEQNLTGAQFAKKLGVSPTMVYKAEHGNLLAYWRYTRKINSVFGTNFPDVSVCKECGCDFEGLGRYCPNCMHQKVTKTKEKPVLLKSAVKNAEKLNISYGAFSAGISVKKNERTTKPPEFLALGRTITI